MKQKITIKIKKATRQIVLYGTNLQIKEAAVINHNSLITHEHIVYDAETRTVTIEFDTEIKPPKVTLLIEYEGILKQKESKKKSKTAHDV